MNSRLDVPQDAADVLDEMGLRLDPLPGQVVITPPSARQKEAAYQQSLLDGTWHLTKKELTEEQRKYIQKLVRIQRKLRKARNRK